MVYDPMAHLVWGQGGWLLTRNRSAFIGAMRKLAEQNLAEPKPHPRVT